MSRNTDGDEKIGFDGTIGDDICSCGKTLHTPSSVMNKKENTEFKRDPLDAMKESRNKALAMQRKQRLHALVSKRKANLSYLVKVHQGGVFWLNCIHLSNEDICRYTYAVPKNRTLSYYYLAASTSAIVALPSGFAAIRAFLQLLEEWEYYFAGTATQSMKFVLAKTSPCSFPVPLIPTSSLGNEDELRLPSINKFDNNVIYEYLNTTHVPFELDYIEVLYSLCESVGALYNKFLSEDCSK